MKSKRLLIGSIILASSIVRSDAQVINGDFSNGLDAWIVFLPPSNNLSPANGTATTDIDGSGPLGVSTAFYANVGGDALLDIQQNLSLFAGTKYIFSANLAMSTLSNNGDGGTVAVYANQNLIATYSFGSTTYNVNKYAVVNGSYVPASTGVETLSINFSRGYGDGGVFDTPIDYITNIQLAPVPEPSTFAFVALGGLGFLAWKNRPRAEASMAK